MDNGERIKVVGGELYNVIINTICCKGVKDSISGDIYISHDELRVLLGSIHHVPPTFQMRIIKELIDNNHLVVTVGGPGSVILRRTNTGEVFYCLKNKHGVDD